MKRTLLVAALLCALLFALALLARWDEEEGSRQQQSATEQQRVLPFAADSYHKITIKHPQSSAIVLVRSQAQGLLWHLKAPLDEAADQDRISALLVALSTYRFEKKITCHRDLWPQYGLSDEAIQVAVEAASPHASSPFRLRLGAPSPVGYGLYFAREDNGCVYLGSQHLLLSVGQDLAAWRQKVAP